MSSIGPELPPHLLAKRKRQAETEDTSAADSAKVKDRPRSPSSDGAEKRRRVVGPAPPPAPLDELPRTSAQDEEDSSSDDDYGPSLPTGNNVTSSYDAEYDDELLNNAQSSQASTKKVERDEWMMMPPTQDGLAARMDPTKLRPGKFRSGRAAGGPAGGGMDSTWTETPEQKRKRLENEVLGIAAPANSSNPTTKKQSAEDEAAARRIKEYNEKHRGKSLYDEHKKTKPEEREDDPSKRAFDREKDVAGGMKIGHAKRKELVSRASDFSSKFSGGGYL